jgi:hypothetical protein
MRYEIVSRRYRFYMNWYMSMNAVEQTSFIGQWVLERMKLLSEALREFEKLMPRHHRPIGNYKPPSFNQSK